MRILRYCAYALLLIIAAFVTALVVLLQNQQRITAYALERIYQRTGVRITVAASKIGLGGHLAVVLENPHIAYNGVPLGSLDSIRFVLSYPALLFQGGLPLAALDLDAPRLRLPAPAAELPTAGAPRLSPALVEAVRDNLSSLADVAKRLDVVDGAASDETGQEIVDGLNLRLHRAHLRPTEDRPWLLDFNASLEQPPIHGAKIAGQLALQPKSSSAAPVVSGELWFWGLHLDNAQVASIRASGNFDARIHLTMDTAGVFAGAASGEARALAFGLGDNPAAWKPPDLQISVDYKISLEQIELQQITVQQSAKKVAQGTASLSHPFSIDRSLQLTLGSARLELARVAALLRALPHVNDAVTSYARGLTGGELLVGDLSLRTPLPLSEGTIDTVRNQLAANVEIRNASYEFPSNWQVPQLQHFNAQLAYSAGALSVTQTSFDLGDSKFDNLSATLSLRDAPSRLRYSVQAGGRLDAGALYPALARYLRERAPAAAKHLRQLSGRIAFSIWAKDELPSLVWRMPRRYSASLRPNRLTAVLASLPQPLVVAQGAVVLTPGVVKANRMLILPEGASGDAILDGIIEPRANGAAFRHFTLEPHRLPVENWLPHFVDADTLAADGLVGGLLTVNGEATAHTLPAISGKLTLGAGDLSLGFLRSPIQVSAATLTLDGRGLILNLPGGWLEGEPLDFRMAVPDLRHPAVRIDARAGKLDLLVMRFIRLPWSHPRPPRFFAAPVRGHLAADYATFGRLAMSKVSTDFSRDYKIWRVYNFAAQAYSGTIALEIDGRTGPDNWIHMIGATSEMNSAALMDMADASAKPILSGALSVKFNLWGNTDTNFFSTLAGTFSLNAHDGVLHRFSLLSRILSLINLKNWITAQFPDPRASGIPYTSIVGDFTGVQGDFYTKNLRLSGPLMDISARGDIQFGQSRLDMEVGMVPFSTVNWIVSHIPIIGANLAGGTRGLVGAYFHVYGPTNKPTIIPKPITSITEFVKRTLGLPVNIIAPHTIR